MVATKNSIIEIEHKISKGKLFIWRKSNTRSKEWDNFLHVFEKDGDESSQLPFIKCIKCNSIINYNSKHGNKRMIDHNLKCKPRSLITQFTTNHHVVISAGDKNLLHEKIAHFVADTLSPFKIVENKSFISMMEYSYRLGSKHSDQPISKNLPTRKQIKNIIFSEYEKMVESSKETLNRIPAEHITCSVDIWTDNSLLNSYMDFSFVYFEEFNLKYRQYKMIHFPQRHTSVNIYETVDNVLGEIFTDTYNIRIISDSAANMTAGLNNYKHFRCAAHRLNTIISNGMHIFLYKL